MKLSELQKRVELLEKLTTELAQWVGFSIGKGDKGKDEDEGEEEVMEKRGGLRSSTRRRGGGVAKKSTKVVEDTTEVMNHDEEPEPEADTSSDEYPDKDDIIGDPDFEADVDFPLILPTSSGIKEEQDSDYDEYDNGSLSVPSASVVTSDEEEEDIRSGRDCSPGAPTGSVVGETHSLRKSSLLEPYVKLDRRMSTSALKDKGKTTPQNNKDTGKQQRQWNCKRCTESFASRDKLYLHVKDVHKAKPREPLICPFNCPQGTKKPFKSRFQLQEHIRMHTGEKPNLCQICGLGFRTNQLLKKHIGHNHTEKPKESKACDRCGKLFYTKQGLERHMLRKHTDGGNPLAVQCDKCFIVFSCGKSLRMHIRNIHENRRSFICEICGRGFKKPYCLKEHLERHAKNPNLSRRPELPPRARGIPVPPIGSRDTACNANVIQNQAKSIQEEPVLPQQQLTLVSSPTPTVPRESTPGAELISPWRQGHLH